MTIRTIPSNDILGKLDAMRTAIIMVDTDPARAEGPRAGDHMIGAGGTARIDHMEATTFGRFKTAAVVTFDTPENLAKAVKPFGIHPGQGWTGGGSKSGSLDISGNGDVTLAGKTFAAVASAEGASVIYDGGLAALTATRDRKVAAWLYEHDGMVHDRDHPARLTVNRKTGITEPWNERAVEIDPAGRPKRGDLMEFAPTKSGEKLWTVLDGDTLKALEAAANPRLAIIATRQDLRDAISTLAGSDGVISPTSRVLAGLAPAIAQPQWERAEYGRLKETGKVKTGRDALVALEAGFGRGEHRKVVLDQAKAEDLANGMGRSFKKAYDQALATSAERDAAFQEARKATGAKKDVGASR